MQTRHGTYALVFSAPGKRQIAVGKIGTLQLQPGFYIYVGSAFGPGGLKARIAHHSRIPTRPHWHVDYLASDLGLTEIWYTFDPVHREHQWAAAIASIRGASLPLAGFGSSDCGCTSHLFFFNTKPAIGTFRRKVQAGTDKHGKVLFKKIAQSRELQVSSEGR